MTLELALMLLPGLVIGLSLHEAAHAWSASLLGDDYARSRGRVSLNPFRHLSLLGTLAIFVLPFGWAKPVMVNTYNFRRPRRDYLLTSLAGPAANIIVVAACVGLMHLTRHSYWFADGLGATAWRLSHVVLYMVALINLILAAVNLIPLPPLDGSKIWPVLFPRLSIERLGKATLLSIGILLLLLWTGQVDRLIGAVLAGTDRLFPTSDQQRYEERVDAGTAASDDDDFDRAERLFTEALEINPHGLDALFMRSADRNHLGRHEDALADLDRLIELGPDDYEPFELQRLRGWTLLQLGREEEAMSALNRALELAGDDKRKRELVERYLGPRSPATQPSSAPNALPATEAD
jgi:Zn-dependent protease